MSQSRVKAELFYHRFNITDDELQDKIEENIRFMDLRGGSLYPGDVAKYGACVHLAVSAMNVQIDLDVLVKMCGERSHYLKILTGVSSVLKTNLNFSFEKLGVIFGCSEIVPLAKKLFKKYVCIYLKALPEDRRPSARFTSVAFKAASFAIAAEYSNVKLSRKRLLHETFVSSAEFKEKYSSIYQIVMKPLAERRSKRMEQYTEEENARSSLKRKAEPQIREDSSKKRRILPDENTPSNNQDLGPSEINASLDLSNIDQFEYEEFESTIGKSHEETRSIHEIDKRKKFEEWQQKTRARKVKPLDKPKQTKITSFFE